MDTQKDIIKYTPETTSFFEKDEVFSFVYKKTEKLITALYMVTNLFSDSEPMKWNVRGKASDLLSFTVGYKNISGSRQFDFTDGVKTRVMEIVSFLEIALHSGLVSPMNFSIIKQEFINLVDTFAKSESSPKESPYNALPNSFFAGSVQNAAPKIPVESVKDKTPTVTNVFAKTDRQNIILGLLKKKNELTIKDISRIIKNCSEKTIQRELVALITLGILKKTGQRRWSKYSLKNGQ